MIHFHVSLWKHFGIIVKDEFKLALKWLFLSSRLIIKIIKSTVKDENIVLSFLFCIERNKTHHIYRKIQSLHTLYFISLFYCLIRLNVEFTVIHGGRRDCESLWRKWSRQIFPKQKWLFTLNIIFILLHEKNCYNKKTSDFLWHVVAGVRLFVLLNCVYVFLFNSTKFIKL